MTITEVFQQLGSEEWDQIQLAPTTCAYLASQLDRRFYKSLAEEHLKGGVCQARARLQVLSKLDYFLELL